MKSIGILPAGGNATRFRGIAKELLPVSPAECALSRAVRAMQNGGASEIYIASRHDRLPEHWRAIENTGGCHLTAKPFRRWWEFVRYIGRTVEADRYYFAMPDTVFPLDAFAREVTAEVTAGAFYTDKPGRFGILSGNVILDKHPTLAGHAWGVWIWTRAAMESIVRYAAANHDTGLNRLLAEFGLQTFGLDYYYDFATFEDYTEFLCQAT
jgi:hypothetical protein